MAKKRKIIGWTVAGIIVLGVIGSMMGGAGTETAVEPSKVESKVNTKEEPKKAETVTKANYDLIKQGDALSGEGGATMEEVIAILGEPSDKTESETTINGQTTKTTMASWFTLDLESIAVTFTNGKVSHKMWMD